MNDKVVDYIWEIYMISKRHKKSKAYNGDVNIALDNIENICNLILKEIKEISQ